MALLVGVAIAPASVCKIHARDAIVYGFAGDVSSERFDATTIAARERAGLGDLGHKARRIADALQAGLVEHFRSRRIERARRELVDGQRGRHVTGFIAALVDGKPQGFGRRAAHRRRAAALRGRQGGQGADAAARHAVRRGDRQRPHLRAPIVRPHRNAPSTSRSCPRCGARRWAASGRGASRSGAPSRSRTAIRARCDVRRSRGDRREEGVWLARRAAQK